VIKFSMTFHKSTQNSITFQAWKAEKQNSSSRFSRTRTNNNNNNNNNNNLFLIKHIPVNLDALYKFLIIVKEYLKLLNMKSKKCKTSVFRKDKSWALTWRRPRMGILVLQVVFDSIILEHIHWRPCCHSYQY